MDCLANIRFLDALDQPIEGLAHEIWVGSTIISDYVTLGKGESVWIKRSVGTVLDVRIKNTISGEYEPKVKIELIGDKTVFIVRSPKVLLKGIKLFAKDVATGTYLRSTYIVAEGDYLSRIAADNHTTTAELCRINNLKNDTDIHPGQVLKIPLKKNEVSIASSENKPKLAVSTVEKQEKTTVIVVQKRDTLSLIAKLTDNSVDEIKKLNNLANDKIIQNQRLKVYDRNVTRTQPKIDQKFKQASISSPKIKQEASQNKEKAPVAKVESAIPVNVKGLLPQACGGEKHYKRTLARLAELHPIYQPYVIKLINTGYQQLGICWVVTDGYRSPSAQDALPSTNTKAKGLSSYHQYGLAIDIYSVRDGEIVLYNAKLSIKERKQKTENDLKKLGPIGEKLGLVWGGRWKSIIDNPHYELHPNGKTWRDLKPKLLEIGVSKYKQLKF